MKNNKEKNLKNLILNTIDKTIMSKWSYLILALLSIHVSYCLFLDKSIFFFIHFKNIGLFGKYGEYGEFVGGVFGTIVTLISVLLLIKTFKHQQEITKENKVLVETQRFNNLFFELLKVYQEQVKELQETYKEGKVTHLCNNKDFFDCLKKELYEGFEPSNNAFTCTEYAIDKFSDIYFRHKSKIAIYYRILYRIFDLIDKSNINEDEKAKYSKIVRAQLTESELLCIRYNAITYGEKFVKYIVKYNILKHLPIFELLEYKKWSKELLPKQRIDLDMIFYDMSKALRKYDHEKKINMKKNSYNEEIFNREVGKYTFIIELHSKLEITMKLIIDNSENDFKSDNASDGLNLFNNEELQLLLNCLINEYVIDLNFGTLNKVLEYDTPPIEYQNNGLKTIISSTIKCNKPISFKSKLS